MWDVLPLTQISYGEHSSLSNRQPVQTDRQTQVSRVTLNISHGQTVTGSLLMLMHVHRQQKQTEFIQVI